MRWKNGVRGVKVGDAVEVLERWRAAPGTGRRSVTPRLHARRNVVTAIACPARSMAAAERQQHRQHRSAPITASTSILLRQLMLARLTTSLATASSQCECEQGVCAPPRCRCVAAAMQQLYRRHCQQLTLLIADALHRCVTMHRRQHLVQSMMRTSGQFKHLGVVSQQIWSYWH